MTRTARAASLALLLLSTAASAGPVAEFESGFRELYGSYREALFHTNTGKQELSAEALDGLEAGWARLTADYGAAPPPQYADDPAWGETLSAVAAGIAMAREHVAAGRLAEAHEGLEAVREEIGALHDRNGVETFSDRMNAYHAEMEHVLATDLSAPDAERLLALRERAAVLAYLAQDVLGAPPPEAAGDPAYDELAAAFRASVEAFQAAARSGGAEALKDAAAVLKPAYSRLFLKFG